MSSLIKCPKCSTWNENLDYCKICNELINSEMLREREAQRQLKEYRNRPKDVFDLYFERIKTSDEPMDRIMYFLLRSAWFLLIALALAGLAVAALGPG